MLFFLVSAVFGAWATGADASSGYFTSNCAGCHVGQTGSNFCGMCHAHGVHSSSSKSDINVKGVPNKTSYAPGETVSVLISGGYRPTAARAILYDQSGAQLAISKGSPSSGGGPVNAPLWPVTLTAPAPSTPGTYTWKVAWYGNKYDKSGAAFGGNGSVWTLDSGNPDHGWETVPIASFTVAASDTTPPTVSSTAPANGASNISPATAVTATFSEAVTASTVNATTFTLKAGTSSVPGTVTLVGTTATFQPSAPLAISATYTATITTGVKDLAGNAMAANYTWSFTTAAAADTTPPTVTSTNPPGNQTGVAANSSVSATFSEAVAPASVTTTSFTVGGVSGTVSVSGSTATFTPSAPLAYGTKYTATITTAVTDIASNHLAVNYSWSFTTGAAPDTTPPTVASTAPVNGATAVSISSTVSATFSETVDPLTVTTATFSLKQGTVGIPGTVTLSGTTATFRPSAVLSYSATYTATVTTGVKDVAGNAMAANRTWSFTTAAAPDTTPPAVASVTPAAGATGVASNTSVTAAFSEAVDPLTVTTATFTLKNGAATVSGAVSASGGNATFTPSAPLAYSTTYTAALATGIKDLAGNALGSPYSWTFTTGAAPDTTPPTVTGTTPAANATSVPVNTTVTATFSEPVATSTVSTASFTLKDGSGAPVAGAVHLAGTVASFTPSSPLAGGTTYTATITTAVKDTAGNPIAAPYSWSFATENLSPVDTDGDGVPDAIDAFPNDPTRATVSDMSGSGTIMVDASGNGSAVLRNLRAVADTDPALNTTGKPSGFVFPDGLVSYEVQGISPGSSVTVRVTFPTPLPAGSRIYKVTSSGYHEFPGAVISGNMVTLTLTDGGAGDADGVANGIISDPVGVAEPAPGTGSSSSGGGCSMAPKGGKAGDFSGACGVLGYGMLVFFLRARRKVRRA